MNTARAWVRRKSGPDEIVRIAIDPESRGVACCYRIDDGQTLTIEEREQLADFIVNDQDVL